MGIGASSKKNPDVIALSGFSRGGTSIAWNILNSHPNVCAPLYETNEIVHDHRTLRVLFRFPTSMRGRRGRIPRWWVDRVLYRHKMAALEHEDLRLREPETEYTKPEASATTLALKSIDGGVRLTDGLLEVYPGLAIVCVVRDGYAVLEGALRRGFDPDVVGRRYARNGSKMVELSLRYQRSMILRFEEILVDPFAAAAKMYAFAGLPDSEITSLRFKAKRVINTKGVHEPRFGEVDRYFWFSRSNISDAIDPTVNAVQVSRLDPAAVEAFMRHAAPVMKHFGYAE